jgi:ADP-heptose:LPS heptosyltransferase
MPDHLLFHCKMARLELKEFYPATRDARKVVVVDLGFLGDTVHLVPSLWEIKDHYPKAELHVVSAPVGADVLRLARCVDRPWAVTLDPAKRTFAEQWHVTRALRRERFDVALNFSGGDRTNIMTAMTGARHRAAHAAGHRHFWNRWLIPNWVPRQDPDAPVFEQRRQFLTALGFSLHPARFDLRVDDSSKAWAEGVVPPGAIHISVNSATPFNEWPVENYTAMLKSLWRVQPDLRIVASSSARERERLRLRQLDTQVADTRLQLLPENLTIPQLAAVLKRCRLHLGPDSGVVHLAAALGVPTVAFFREQSGFKAWLPSGAGHRAITVPCACLEQQTPECHASGRTECFARIEPGRISVLVCEQLGLNCAAAR